MNRIAAIIIALTTFFSCSDKVGSWHYASELQSARDMIQEHPDSALKSLMDFENNDESSTTHEYHILLAEALYKNNYRQTIDSAVASATDFYDSIFTIYPKNKDLAFQTARAHYYKAVGETEKDNIVSACKDYLETVEIMEHSFPRHLADTHLETRFLALAYYRIGHIFYTECDAAISIENYRRSLILSQIIEDSAMTANLYRNIGHSFYLNNECDSALVYYNRAINTNNSTDCVENIIAEIYHRNGSKDTAFNIMKNLLENDSLNLSYHMTIGNMLYNDNRIDSALYHLNYCFSSNKRFIKLQSSSLLSAIYDSLGEYDKKAFYDEYYSKNARNELDRIAKSKSLLDFYNQHKEEKHLNQQRFRNMMFASCFIILSLVSLAIWSFIHIKSKKRHFREMSDKNKTISDYEQKTNELERQFEAMKKSSKYKGNDTDNCLMEFSNHKIHLTIRSRVEIEHITTKNISSCKNIALSNTEKTMLKNAATKCIPGLVETLSDFYGINGVNTIVCCLCLLDMSTVEIAALNDMTYQGANKRINSIKKMLKSEGNLKDILTKHIHNLYN